MKLRSLALLPFLFSALLSAQIFHNSSDRQMSDFTGAVRSPDGKPVDNVRVQVFDANTGAAVASAYTNSQGVFDVGNIRSGNYEVVADAGVSETRERVDTRTWDGTLQLRTPQGKASEGPGGMNTGTVSVADYKVPKKARDAYEKARAAVSKNEPEKVDKYVEEALNIYPEYSDALTLRGIRNLDRKNADAAITDLDRAVKADSSNARAYLVLASAFNVKQRYDDALRILDRASALAPNAWQRCYEMAKAYFGKAQYEVALRWFTRAQDRAPKTFTALYLAKVNAFIALKNYPGATHELETFLNVAPTDPQATEARAMLAQLKPFAKQ